MTICDMVMTSTVEFALELLLKGRNFLSIETDVRYLVGKNADFKLNYCHDFLRKSKEKFATNGL